MRRRPANPEKAMAQDLAAMLDSDEKRSRFAAVAGADALSRIDAALSAADPVLRRDMSPADKQEYIERHGWDAYHALPL